jgi:predicted nucleic acid-binding protein
MNFVVVDAIIWVSRLVPQGEHHERCQKWLAAQRAAGITLVSPSLLLPGVASAISRRTGDATLTERAVQNLQSLPGLRLIEMNQTVVQAAAQLASSCSMRGADSIYAAVAQQLNIPLVTLDLDQRTKAGKIVAIQEDFR